MPLRPLNENGQPKSEKELLKGEVEGRRQEVELDRVAEIARRRREATEAAILGEKR